MKMDIKPIDICFEDLNLYTRTAYVLDQQNLLEAILEIRKLWKLDEKLITYNSFSVWLAEPHYDFSLSKQVADYLLQIQDKLYNNEAKKYLTEQEVFELTKMITETDPIKLELEYILLSGGINPSFKNILLKAIVCGKIGKEDKPEQVDFQYKNILNDPRLNLVVDNNYQGKREKRKILRDRPWYWMWYEEKDKGFGSYGRVLDNWNTKCPDPLYEPHEKCKHCLNEVNPIEQAVSRYRKFLRS